MALATGRSGTITERDREILMDLFFCRYMSTKQLEYLFFPSASKARTRLAKLAKKGYITNRTMYILEPKDWHDRVSPQGVWHLTKAGFDSITESLGIEETYASKPLLPKEARHYVRAAEVYVAAKHILDEELDSYPEWEWLHEKRVLYSGEYANVPYQHKPDAHVVFRGHTFILERQTTESKIGPKKIYKKVEDHKRYVELKLRAPAEVLFAFDAEGSHLVDAAKRAGEQHGIRVVAGEVEQIAHYLYNSAVRLY